MSFQVKKAIEADPTITPFFSVPPEISLECQYLSAVKDFLDFEPFKCVAVANEAHIDFLGQEASPFLDFQLLAWSQLLSRHLFKSWQIPRHRTTPLCPLYRIALATLTPEYLSFIHLTSQTLVAGREALIKHLQSSSLTSLGIGPIIRAKGANFVVVWVLSEGVDEEDSAVRRRCTRWWPKRMV
ncbi:hypothetical protein DL96DRAFT_1721948 [Flagelloscypha sp. PMI_526]|nr:hypothetical protein DL96DRAFT_1721948 [Flagelloscypha sp. PMI_526]